MQVTVQGKERKGVDGMQVMVQEKEKPERLILGISLTEKELELIDEAVKVSPMEISTRRKFHSFFARVLSRTLESVVNSVDALDTDFLPRNEGDKSESSNASVKLRRFLFLLEEDFKNDLSFLKQKKTNEAEEETKTYLVLRLPSEREKEFLKKNFSVRRFVKACLLYAANKIIELEGNSARKVSKRKLNNSGRNSKVLVHCN